MWDNHSIPILDCSNSSIASDYGCLSSSQEDGRSDEINRALFVIDRAGLVRHTASTTIPVKRNFEEILGLVRALKQEESENVQENVPELEQAYKVENVEDTARDEKPCDREIEKLPSQNPLLPSAPIESVVGAAV